MRVKSHLVLHDYGHRVCRSWLGQTLLWKLCGGVSKDYLFLRSHWLALQTWEIFSASYTEVRKSSRPKLPVHILLCILHCLCWQGPSMNCKGSVVFVTMPIVAFVTKLIMVFVAKLLVLLIHSNKCLGGNINYCPCWRYYSVSVSVIHNNQSESVFSQISHGNQCLWTSARSFLLIVTVYPSWHTITGSASVATHTKR